LADVGSSSRTTFLDWHPQYPVVIASTCDAATASNVYNYLPVLMTIFFCCILVL